VLKQVIRNRYFIFTMPHCQWSRTT